jgi:hypothetical protein
MQERRYTSREIARHVSRRTGVPFHTVWPLVQDMLCVVHQLLDDGQTVWLDGIGTFKWKPVVRSNGIKLRWHPHRRFKRGRPMEKYGVEFDDQKTKEAQQGKKPGRCPICDRELDSGGACPEHGTEPLEKRPDE